MHNEKQIAPPLWLLMPLVAFPQIGETIYTPCLPNMVQAFATSTQMVNLTLSLYLVGFALGVLCFGILCDRIGRRPSMLLGLSIYVIASAFCILAPNILTLLISRLAQGFGASVGSVVVQTMMRDLYIGVRRSQVFSLVTAALALSPAIGPLIGGGVDELVGFKGNFAVLLLMGLLLLIISHFQLNETQPPEIRLLSRNSVFSVSTKMLADPRIWKSVFMVAGCNGILFSFYGEAPYIFQKILGYTPSEYGRIGIAIALSSMLGALLSHRLGSKLATERLVQIGAGLTLTGAMLFFSLASVDFINSSTRNLSTACVIFPMAFIFVGFGLIIPNTLAVALKAYATSLGIAGAVLGLSYYLFIALITEGMGLLHNGTIMAMPSYFVGLSAFMCLVSFLKVVNVEPHINRA